MGSFLQFRALLGSIFWWLFEIGSIQSNTLYEPPKLRKVEVKKWCFLQLRKTCKQHFDHQFYSLFLQNGLYFGKSALFRQRFWFWGTPRIFQKWNQIEYENGAFFGWGLVLGKFWCLFLWKTGFPRKGPRRVFSLSLSLLLSRSLLPLRPLSSTFPFLACHNPLKPPIRLVYF